MPGPYQGSCLCNKIRFEVDEFIPNTGNCHCSMCRKFHGAAFATLAEAWRKHFRWLSGEDSLKAYTASNGTTRLFCNHCGSSLMFSSPNADPASMRRCRSNRMRTFISARAPPGRIPTTICRITKRVATAGACGEVLAGIDWR